MPSYSEISDIELIKKIKDNDDNEAIKTLIKRHEGIAFSIHNKFKNKMLESGVCHSPDFSEKDYIMYQCAKNFDETKSCKYSSHVANYVRYFCLNSLKNIRETAVDAETLDYLVEGDDKKNHLDIQNFYLNISYINNLISQLKDERTKKIFQLRYFSEKKMTWRKIAKKMKLSSQMVINLHNGAVKILKRKLLSQNISDTI